MIKIRSKGKTAIITGSASGIGKACAKLFAKEGAEVVVADIETENGKKTVKEIEDQGGKAMFIKVDVTDSNSVKRMIEKTVEKYGKLDVLHNNAGVYVTGPTENLSIETWDRVLDINLRGVFLGCKYAIPQMKKKGKGVIINTGSESAVSGFANQIAYDASKGGVLSMTESLAAELAPDIRVNCVNPGRVFTPMIEKHLKKLPKNKAEEMKKKIAETVPIGRWVSPIDVAEAVVFLASDQASAITGASIAVDGGTTCTIVWGKPLPKIPIPSEL